MCVVDVDSVCSLLTAQYVCGCVDSVCSLLTARCVCVVVLIVCVVC